MAWNIAHIASDEALKRAVCSEVRSESDPFARGASISSMTSAGIAISANKSELPLLDKCMRETNRLYGILLLVREVCVNVAWYFCILFFAFCFLLFSFVFFVSFLCLFVCLFVFFFFFFFFFFHSIFACVGI
jgi:hypothetical protein